MNDVKQVFSRAVIVGVFQGLTIDCHDNATKKGFYDDYKRVSDALFSEVPDANNVLFYQAQRWLESTAEQAAIARMHSELSEWLEAVRHPPTADKHCPDFWNTEIEAADLIIRVLDTCGYKGYRIGEAVLAKMEYNVTRPYKHDKNS